MSFAKYINIDDLRFVANCFYIEDCKEYMNCNSCNKNAASIIDLDDYDCWIPYDEFTPDDNDCYLVAWKPVFSNGNTTSGHFYAICEYDLDEKAFCRNEIMDKRYQDIDINILAWMPLPKQYKEEL